jgi:hypothetical protein
MKFNREFFGTTAGQLVLIGALIAVGVCVMQWQRGRRQTTPLPAAAATQPPSLPKTFAREIAKFPKIASPAESTTPAGLRLPPPVVEKPRIVPLTLFAAKSPATPLETPIFAPYGRLVPARPWYRSSPTDSKRP